MPEERERRGLPPREQADAAGRPHSDQGSSPAPGQEDAEARETAADAQEMSNEDLARAYGPHTPVENSRGR